MLSRPRVFSPFAGAGLVLGLAAISPAPAAPATDVRPATWEEVAAAPGELSFTRRITGLALTCPANELPTLFGRAEELPAERRTLARILIAGAWMERDLEPAMTYWREHHASLDSEIRQIFYNRLALVDPARAEAELAHEPSREAADAYRTSIIRMLAETNPEAALPFLHAMDEKGAWLWAIILGSLARTDRERALAEAAKITDANGRRFAYGGIVHAWFSSEPEAALHWAAANLPADDAESLASSLISELTRRDPEAARRLAQENASPAVKAAYSSALGSLHERQLYETIVAHGWADVPRHALSFVLEHVETLPAEEALRFFKNIPAERLAQSPSAVRVAGAWTLLDPEGAQAWAATITDTSLHSEVTLRINTMLTELDPKLALAQIEACPPGPLQSKLVSNTAKAFGKKDLPGAIAWVASLPPGPNQSEGFEGLSFIGAEFNPAGMIEGLSAIPTSQAKTHAYKEFARVWADMDAGAALDWFIRLPAGAEREGIRETVFQQAAAHAGDRVLELVSTLEDPREQAVLVQKLATRLATEDPASAIALVESLPANHERNTLTGSVANALAKQHPELAADFVLRNAIGSDRHSRLASVAGAWARNDPSAAAAWLDRLRADPALASGLPQISQSVAKVWARHDAAAAAAFFQRMPAGRERELALASVAEGMIRRFPTRGFDLLAAEPSSLKNPAHLNNFLNNWRQFAPEAAERHIRASSLPDSLKAQLLGAASPTR